MADKRIDQVPAVVTPAGTDKILVFQSGATKYETATQLLAAITTAYQSADTTLTTNVATLSSTKAPIASPTFTGVPAAPTAASGTNTTQLATTAFATTADLLRLRLSGADTMLGALNMGSNKINNVTNGTSAQDAVTLSQVQTLVAESATTLEDYNPTITSAFPTTWGGTAIEKGNRFYITTGGTMAAGISVVQAADIIEARVDLAADSPLDWSIIERNAIQATTSVAGIGETATDAEALAKSSILTFVTPSNFAAMASSETFAGLAEIATQAEVNTGTDDLRFVTPLKLATNFATKAFWSLTGNSGLTPWTNFIGTTDGVALTFKVNSERAGIINTAGDGSMFFGYKCGNVNTSVNSTGFGYQALLLNTTGVNNVAIGLNVLAANIIGGNNTGIGANALTLTTDSNNSGFGFNSLSAVSSGSGNTGVGSGSGTTITTGTNCTLIGYLADTSAALTNATAIGANATVTASNCLVLGSGVRVGIGISAPNASSILDLASTTGALLIPRMTTAQKNLLTAVNGMLVYDSTLNKFQGYEAGVWTSLI